MSNYDKSERLYEFGEWASNLEFDDIPESVVRKTKTQVANMIAAAAAAANSQEERLTSGLEAAAGSGNCTTVTGNQTDPVTAYFINATLSMMDDYDDYLFMGHTCHSAVFAPLAVGEYAGKDSEEGLTAMVIANELGGRFGAAASNGPFGGQTWTFIHRAEAAAATAVLLDEDAEGIVNAVNLALYNPEIPLYPGFFGGDTKAFSASSPGSDGIRAALLGHSGAVGYDGILEEEGGFLERFSYLPYPEMLSGFGEGWVTESLAFKPHPGCAYIQSALDCVAEIQTETELEAKTIERIRIEVGDRAFSMEKGSRRYRDGDRIPPVNVTFSVPASVAIHMLEGEFTTRHLTEEYLQTNLEQIKEIERKTTLVHNQKYTDATADGYKQVVDFAPLFNERSDQEIIRAFHKSAQSSGGTDVFEEISAENPSDPMPTAISYQERVLDNSLDWETFDLGKANFKDFRFDFGCSVEIETSEGETYRKERKRHRGAPGEGIEETEEMVYDKMVYETKTLLGSEQKATAVRDAVSTFETSPITEVLAPFQE